MAWTTTMTSGNMKLRPCNSWLKLPVQRPASPCTASGWCVRIPAAEHPSRETAFVGGTFFRPGVRGSGFGPVPGFDDAHGCGFACDRGSCCVCGHGFDSWSACSCRRGRRWGPGPTRQLRWWPDPCLSFKQNWSRANLALYLNLKMKNIGELPAARGNGGRAL